MTDAHVVICLLYPRPGLLNQTILEIQVINERSGKPPLGFVSYQLL